MSGSVLGEPALIDDLRLAERTVVGERPAGELQWETRNDSIGAGAITHKNLSIQSLRGLAALFVALFHASVFSGRHFGDSAGQQLSMVGSVLLASLDFSRSPAY